MSYNQCNVGEVGVNNTLRGQCNPLVVICDDLLVLKMVPMYLQSSLAEFFATTFFGTYLNKLKVFF